MNSSQPTATKATLPRSGVTLIELLIATALTLLVMGAVATLFGQVGDAVSGSRQTLQMSEQLRNAKELFIRDLRGATVRGVPPLSPASELGYLEIGQGTQRDRDYATTGSPRGAQEDWLALTTTADAPFEGNYGKGAVVGPAEPPPDPEPVDCTGIQSPVIIDNTGAGFSSSGTWTNFTTGGYGGSLVYAAAGSSSTATWQFNNLAPGSYQVLVTWVQHTNRPTNASYSIQGDTSETASGINQRNAPLAHASAGGFNFQRIGNPLDVSGTLTVSTSAATANGFLIADAIRVECVGPLAVQPPPPPPPVAAAGSLTVVPTDAAYVAGIGAIPVAGYGAFVDLGVYAPGYTPAAGAPQPAFNRAPAANSGLTTPTYCTWSNHYNTQNSDGFDSNASGVIDSHTEAEAQPPYAAPLKAVELVLRVYEPGSRTVRQVTIREQIAD